MTGGTVGATAEVDLLVVGSGTGMAAALAGHDLGLEVLIVEKTDKVGGSTALSGGAFWIPGNPVIATEGGRDSVDRAREYLADLVGDMGTADRWENYLRFGPATVRLLQRLTRLNFMWSKGYSDYHAERPGGSAVGRTCESKPFDVALLGPHRDELRSGSMAAPIPMPITGVDYRLINLMATLPRRGLGRAMRRLTQGLGGKAFGREYVAGGQALAAGLYDAVLRAGIPVWRNTGLVRLVTEGGRVTGAVVDRNGTEVTVTTRNGVILAAGGFDHAADLRRRYQLGDLPELSLGSPGNTGDALAAATDVGAGLALLEQAWWFPAVAPVPGGAPKVMLAERSLPGSLMVDHVGDRFIDEATDYMSFGQEVLARQHENRPTGQMWIIFDQKYRNSYVFAGELLPHARIPQAWFDAGIAYEATTIAELADATGLSHLTSTVDRFNEFAEAGIDDDFRRGDSAYDRYYGDPSNQPNPCLRALTHGPFFAVKVVLSDLGTCGGLRADGTARVVSDRGDVIDGLYAIGNTAANAFGNRYPGAGATIGQGLVYGYIAAHHAADRLNMSEPTADVHP
ncbi:3-ketosteroid-delta-1-dehydrogenase [Gordonia liuliyuniae]|uniref:3-ketosteroid-delta-1-dehydrogenase n=1 Tax=Gordonia liuliyuniae TaxID=2911517 RepID=A0ABS9IQ80_9ACTN|nr:3-ketosteroid-delta-1-dehydrogenase [Gordonia liuliyuniae]MCF8587721.1 3-ketosteroid-delta-1-dehydrogenase [Gordonia liuliyuniae]